MVVVVAEWNIRHSYRMMKQLRIDRIQLKMVKKMKMFKVA